MSRLTPTNIPTSRLARKASNKRRGCVCEVLQNRQECLRRSSETSGNYCHGLTIDQSVTKTFLTFPGMRWVPSRPPSLFCTSSDERSGREAHANKEIDRGRISKERDLRASNIINLVLDNRLRSEIYNEKKRRGDKRRTHVSIRSSDVSIAHYFEPSPRLKQSFLLIIHLSFLIYSLLSK